MPDSEIACREILAAASEVTDVFGQRIVTDLARASGWPALRMSDLGGAGIDEIDQRRDVAILRLEAWGNKTDEDHPEARAELKAGVEAVRAAIAAASDVPTLTTAGWVSRSRELSRPAWAPDPTNNRPRFTWTVELTILQEG